MKFELKTIAATKKAARELARGLSGNELLLLSGELAAGKTTFVKLLAEALGFQAEDVSSPSFTIVNRYSSAKKPFGIYHLDFYRLANGSSLEPLGLEHILGSDDLVAVEWPEAGAKIFERSPRNTLLLRFELSGGKRFLTVERLKRHPSI